jgi:hypothetical protein
VFDREDIDLGGQRIGEDHDRVSAALVAFGEQCRGDEADAGSSARTSATRRAMNALRASVTGVSFADAPQRDRGAVAVAQDVLREHPPRRGQRVGVLPGDAPVHRHLAPHEKAELVGRADHPFRRAGSCARRTKLPCRPSFTRNEQGTRGLRRDAARWISADLFLVQADARRNTGLR